MSETALTPEKRAEIADDIGCFHATLDELAAAAKETHEKDHPRYYQEYIAAITLCRTIWNIPLEGGQI